MFDSPEQFAEYLDKLAEAAPKLRIGGVLRFELGPLKADLVQMAGDLLPKPDAKASADDDDYDPLKDPVSYGLEPGAKLPFDDDGDDDDGEED
jgi:hypothetical protein